MPSTSLRVAAARYALGLLPSEAIPQVADDALKRGLYTDALGRLYDLRDPVMSEAGPLFESALRELGVAVPSRDAAIFILLKHHTGSIIEGLVPPYDGLRQIMQEVYYGGGAERKSTKYAGDAYGIHCLVGAYWAYDDLRGRPDEVSFAGKYGEEGIARLDEEVVKQAAAWHRRHGSRAVSPAVLAWSDGTVMRMAQGIHEERAFDRLPILGDALLDAGCDDEELIGHCRSAGPHVRGCWALDLILGKS